MNTLPKFVPVRSAIRIQALGLDDRDIIKSNRVIGVFRRRHFEIKGTVVQVFETRGGKNWFLTLTVITTEPDGSHRRVNVRIYNPRTPRVAKYSHYLGAEVHAIGAAYLLRTDSADVIVAEWIRTRPLVEGVSGKSNIMMNDEIVGDAKVVRAKLSDAEVEELGLSDHEQSGLPEHLWAVDPELKDVIK